MTIVTRGLGEVEHDEFICASCLDRYPDLWDRVAEVVDLPFFGPEEVGVWSDQQGVWHDVGSLGLYEEQPGW